MGNKYYFQVFCNGKEYRNRVGGIVELRDDIDDIVAYNDLTQIEQIKSLKGHCLLVENFIGNEYGNYDIVLDDLTHKEKHIISQKVILNAKYFIPSVTGMRKHKLKKIMGNG